MCSDYSETFEDLYGYQISERDRSILQLIRVTMVLLVLFLFITIYFLF